VCISVTPHHTVSKRIVELHRGKLSVSSDGEDHGSIFTLMLPLLPASVTSSEYSDIGSIRLEQPDNASFLDLDCADEKSENDVPPSNISSQINVYGELVPTSENRGSDDLHATLCSSSAPRELRRSVITSLNSHSSRNNIQPMPSVSTLHIPDAPVNPRSFTALAVDDSGICRRMMALYLQERFQTVLTAKDGVEAVSVVTSCMDRREVIDVILMDFSMPHMDGPTATRHIRALGYNGLVLGVTGNTLPADIDMFIQNGADQVFGKPLDVKALDEFIHSEVMV
jgi:CheY-like chemotaxis protein